MLGLVVALLVPPGLASCPWEAAHLLPWSSPDTWPGGVLPADGDWVHVKQNVLLDTDTARLHRLDIASGGRLVFSPNTSVSVTAGAIRV